MLIPISDVNSDPFIIYLIIGILVYTLIKSFQYYILSIYMRKTIVSALKEYNNSIDKKL